MMSNSLAWILDDLIQITNLQVSNWFINARVRIWKPMIEAFYAEMQTSKQERPCATTASWETKVTTDGPQMHEGEDMRGDRDLGDVEGVNTSTYVGQRPCTK